MEHIFRIIIVILGVFLLLPGAFGSLSLGMAFFDLFKSENSANLFEVRTVISGLSMLVGFIGINFLLRADIIAPAKGARIAMIAGIIACLVIAAISLLLFRAISLSATDLPTAPIVACLVIITLSILLAPFPLYLYWKSNRNEKRRSGRQQVND